MIGLLWNAYIKALFQQLLGGSEENQEHLSEDRQSLGHDSKSGPSAHKAEMLTTLLWCSAVKMYWKHLIMTTQHFQFERTEVGYCKQEYKWHCNKCLMCRV